VPLYYMWQACWRLLGRVSTPDASRGNSTCCPCMDSTVARMLSPHDDLPFRHHCQAIAVHESGEAGGGRRLLIGWRSYMLHQQAPPGTFSCLEYHLDEPHPPHHVVASRTMHGRSAVESLLKSYGSSAPRRHRHAEWHVDSWTHHQYPSLSVTRLEGSLEGSLDTW
jgi:hypothetical protein